MKFIRAAAFALLCSATATFAHDSAEPHSNGVPVPVNPMPIVVEKSGPVAAPARLAGRPAFSGQGFWKFVAATDAVPVPPQAMAELKGAHGTLIVDAGQDVVYWGLRHVGWVGFSNQLRNSWVVRGDVAFAQNNLHGADILPRKGKLPLIAAADNEGDKVYLTDTTFLNPQILTRPHIGPYADGKNYHPTDVAFAGRNRLFITDGYGRDYFMPAMVEPFAFEEKIYGGPGFSHTPHGITYDPKSKDILVSARPEGQLKRWSISKEQVLEIGALPPGTLLCDVDMWGDYALAACLDGAKQKPGPLMILNLKTKSIASILRPKEDLGYAFADHMHDACWYIRKSGRSTEVYVIFTAWNPGGIGALKLVNLPD